MVKIRLPWPPSVNSYYGERIYTPKGRTRPVIGVYVKQPGKDYQLLVRAAVGVFPTIETAVNVELLLLPPDRRERDADNVLKALFDALQFSKVFVRDSQVRRLLVEWGEPVAGGQVIVSVGPLVTPQASLC